MICINLDLVIETVNKNEKQIKFLE